MDYFVKHVRIVNSDRFPNRFLTAEIKSPQIETNPPKGSVFSVVQINNPISTSSPIGNRIINTFSNAYFSSDNQSNAVSFETSLKKVNDTLGKITRNGQTNWIGNIHGVFAAINDNQLYITQTGQAEAYLFRNSQVSHITEGLSQKSEPHPLKTFANIISGDLVAGDKILIASPQLFDYFSQPRLQQIIANSELYSAAEQIANILKNEKTRDVNLILLEFNTKEEFSSRIIENQKEIIFLDRNDVSSYWVNFKQYANNVKPLLNKTTQSIQTSYQRTTKFSKEKIIPYTKEKYSAIQKTTTTKIQQLKKTNSTPAVPPVSPDPVKQTPVKPSSPKPAADLTKENLYKINYYSKDSKNKKTPSNNFINSAQQSISSTYTASTNSFKKRLNKLFASKNRSTLYIAIIITLAIILVFSIFSLKQKKTTNDNLQTAQIQLEEAQSKYENEAKLSILYNDNQKAKDLLMSVIATCEEINDIPELETEANNLIDRAQADLDKLTNTVRLSNPKIISEFDSANQFTSVENTLFTASSNQNEIQTTNIESGEPENTIVIPETSGNLQNIAYLGDGKSIIICTNERDMYKTAGETDDLDIVYPLRGEWATANDLITYYGSIYMLDKNEDQIVKYTKTDDGYSQGTNYLKSDIDLQDTISFAIDGEVYLLKQSGEIVKLNRGQQTDFTITIPDIINPITNPQKIYTDSEANSIWVLDSNRIIDFDKTGNFITQYIFENHDTIDDFIVDYQNNTILLLSDNHLEEYQY